MSNGHSVDYGQKIAKRYILTGLGAALLDRFANVDEAMIARFGHTKAQMSLVSSVQMENLSSQVALHLQTAGGSVANTLAGIARMGLRGAFFGKLADDILGARFRGDMYRLGIHFETTPMTDGTSGSCLVLVTPDAERTMCTDLGASIAFTPADLDARVLAATAMFFAEGYIWDWPQGAACFSHAASCVRKHGGRVAFSLADADCVARHQAGFATVLKHDVDILCANISEAEAMFGTRMPDTLARIFGEYQLEAVITRGVSGAWCFPKRPADDATTLHEVPAVEVANPVDLTGAGDQFAAGYLAARTLGADLPQAGQIGAQAASEVIQHFGPQPQSDLRPLLSTF